MGAVITEITQGSPAERCGIQPGETLLTINGNEIVDVLDYRFYMTDAELTLELLSTDGASRRICVSKDEYEDLGLCFSTYLMDKKRACKNHCVFCFIDQLPRGMRESLYFKDDDARLSFLMGNYITLTNLGEREVRRITGMHLSPVNISVHTTDPELRVKMMRNPDAGKALEIMKRLKDHRIKMNCQIVLCKGLNDGVALDRTLHDLSQLYPAVESVAVVPVGLTKHREGLYPLKPFLQADAEAVLEQINAFAEHFKRKHDTRLVYAADEFYLLADREIPPAEFYGEMPQLENGVGLVALLRDEFNSALARNEGLALPKQRTVSIATGTAAFPLMHNCAEKAQKELAGLKCFVYAIENRFFGETVNVAGLVTGGDLITQLRGRSLGDELLIPACMLRHERDLFLDGVSLADAERELHVKIIPVENDGAAFLRAIAGAELNA